MKSLSIIIIGAVGHTKVLADILQSNNLKITGITDSNTIKYGENVAGISVIGNDDIILSYYPQEILLINGIGAVGSTTCRQKTFETFKNKGYQFADVIHESAIVAKDIVYGEGLQVMAGAIIQPGCELGDNIIVNTKSSIDHDCNIGNHVHIAPGATISGGVVIGEGTHIGTGAVVIQGVKIGKKSIVGAGAVVISDISDNTVVVGVPAKVIRRR